MGSKYRNIPVVVDNIRFASKKEASYYGTLKMRKLAGEIDDFECQVQFPIVFNSELICVYIADFVTYKDDKTLEVIDVKGVKTAVYKLKKKLLKVGYGIDIIEK